jgi:hypothetical protein
MKNERLLLQTVVLTSGDIFGRSKLQSLPNTKRAVLFYVLRRSINPPGSSLS